MRSSKPIAVALAGLLAAVSQTASAAIPNPVIIPGGVAPALPATGTGLCIASRVAPNGISDIGPLSAGSYTGDINSFMEVPANQPPLNLAPRLESVLQTLFDLSNNNPSATNVSYGDFIDAMMPACKIGGCDFIINDTTTTFSSRVRGFLNVTPDLVNLPVHIGFYADDALSLTFYGKSGAIYPALLQEPQLGKPTWRMTNTLIFQESGLYPLEILYLEIAEHAALEMSYLKGTFADFQLPANQMPVTNLKTAGFTLFPPQAFSQTISGNPSYADPAQCKQCDRQFVNLPGNNGCDPGYYCNEAALCAPCDSALLCGPTCSPCGGTTPFCINSNGKLDCGGCRDDNDCKDGFMCDPIKHECQECNDDSQCDRGKICVNHECQWCSTPEHCAGNSCNCCPQGLNPKPMQCVPLDDGGPPACVECVVDGDCQKGQVCDTLIGSCFDELPQHERPDDCGDQSLSCPKEFPFCLPGPVGTACAQCRMDTDCGVEGKFCLSGVCETCTKDRRCGNRCETCSGDTPFCSGGQKADTATCVRCTKDEQCNGGKCDLAAHACTPACATPCSDPAKPYCDGKACVQCYADTQCPCGATCNLETNTCDEWCKSNGDCSGDEHCRWADDAKSKECAPGPMPDDAGCGGTLASACQGSIGKKGEDQIPVTAIVGLSMLAFAARRAKRGKS